MLYPDISYYQAVPNLIEMGQEESRLVDENTPPRALKKRDVASVAEYINSGRARRIVVMVLGLYVLSWHMVIS